MNNYVTAGGKIYKLREKKIRSKSGATYGSNHVKITVATDYYTGKQIQHDYTGKTNYEVQKKIDSSKCLTDGQLNLIPNNITVNQLVNEYLNYKKGFVNQYSVNSTLGICRNYIFPTIGDMLIKKIKSDDIFKLQAEIFNDTKRISVPPKVFYILKCAFNYACKKGYLSCNPCIKAYIYSSAKRTQSILNKEQIYKLLVTEKDSIYSGLLAIIFLLALRFGEGVGLSWDQVDFEKKIIVISQQIDVKNKLQKSTKTGLDRIITPPEIVFRYLERQKEIQEQQKINNPSWDNPDNFIFTNSKGKHFRRSSVEEYFRKIMDNTSNPSVDIHSLRRTTATILAENLSLNAVQYYLGHLRRQTSVRYIYPSEKGIEHLTKIMAEHFETPFNNAGLKEIYPY